MANLTSIRGKDWIFNAIWAACGETNAPKCTINIPVTIIFRLGQPFKCLGTDKSTGNVKRLSLEDVGMERNSDDYGFRGEANKLLRACRQLIINYSRDNDYAMFQGDVEEPLVCTVSCNEGRGNKGLVISSFTFLQVTYSDGEREDMSCRTFDILMRNDNWRMQVFDVLPFMSPAPHTLTWAPLYFHMHRCCCARATCPPRVSSKENTHRIQRWSRTAHVNVEKQLLFHSREIL